MERPAPTSVRLGEPKARRGARRADSATVDHVTNAGKLNSSENIVEDKATRRSCRRRGGHMIRKDSQEQLEGVSNEDA